MNRKRRSPIWKLPTDEFRELVKRSSSVREALLFFGITGTGNSFQTFKKRAKEDGIDLSNMPSIRPGGRVGRVVKSIPLEVVMVLGSTYDTTNLKKRLLKKGILENICAICGNDPVWNGMPLGLRLDHINGIHNDNRLPNLRMVCPNCDSQLDTYCGRNRVKNIRTVKNCIDCGKKLSKHNGKRCRSCNSRQMPQKTKIEWPSDARLVVMVKEKNNVQVAKTLGVSETAVRKRLKSLAVRSMLGRLPLEQHTGVGFSHSLPKIASDVDVKATGPR